MSSELITIACCCEPPPQDCDDVGTCPGDLILNFVDFTGTDPFSGVSVDLSGAGPMFVTLTGIHTWTRTETKSVLIPECDPDNELEVIVTVTIQCITCPAYATGGSNDIWYMTVTLSNIDPGDCFITMEFQFYRAPLNGCVGVIGSWTAFPNTDPAPCGFAIPSIDTAEIVTEYA